MANPENANLSGTYPDGTQGKPASGPAAPMSVFSMFPQEDPKPDPIPEPVAETQPAKAPLPTLIAPPPSSQTRERMEFGTVGTWQKHVSPIAPALSAAPIRVVASLETVEIAPIPVRNEPEPRNEPPAPPSETIVCEPIADLPPVKAEPEPEPPPAPEPQPPRATRLAPEPSLPEPEISPASALYLDPTPDNTALFAQQPPAAAHPPSSRPAILSRPWFWQATTGLCLAAAIAATVIAAIRSPSASPLAIAAIGVVNAPAPLYLAEIDSAGTLRMIALATIAVPNGRDLQLWIIPPGEQTPASLGVLPSRGTSFTLPAPPTEGTRFVISMEPRGGATGGRITGQVLYGGTLANR